MRRRTWVFEILEVVVDVAIWALGELLDGL
jgi:hypothetical protein